MVAVILDVDGTLMDTNYLHVEAWARAFRAVGLTVPRSAIHRQIGKGSDQLIAEFTKDEAAGKQVDELYSKNYAALQEAGYPLPGAKDLLASLAERGVAVWWATSGKPEQIEHSLELLDAKERVTGIVSSGDVEASNPEPDLLALTLERVGSSPAETVVVGDTIWDIQAAERVGLRTVAVLTGGAYSRAELEEAGAVAVHRDCAELLAAGFPAGLT